MLYGGCVGVVEQGGDEAVVLGAVIVGAWWMVTVNSMTRIGWPSRGGSLRLCCAADVAESYDFFVGGQSAR